jgi:hypothetical protein
MLHRSQRLANLNKHGQVTSHLHHRNHMLCLPRNRCPSRDQPSDLVNLVNSASTHFFGEGTIGRTTDHHLSFSCGRCTYIHGRLHIDPSTPSKMSPTDSFSQRINADGPKAVFIHRPKSTAWKSLLTFPSSAFGRLFCAQPAISGHVRGTIALPHIPFRAIYARKT